MEEAAAFHRAEVPPRLEITRRIFTLQSTMGSGIHLAMPAAPRGPWEDAARGVSAAPTSPPVAQYLAAAGIVLAATGQYPAGEALSPVPLSRDHISPAPELDLSRPPDWARPQARSVARASVPWEPSAAEGSAAQVGGVTLSAATAVMATAVMAMAVTATVGDEVSGRAMDGVVASSASAGDGASAWAGPTGAATGDPAGRLAGTPGGTTRTGMRLGRIRTTQTTRTRDTTIRRFTTIPMLRMTPTRGQTT